MPEIELVNWLSAGHTLLISKSDRNGCFHLPPNAFETLAAAVIVPSGLCAT